MKRILSDKKYKKFVTSKQVQAEYDKDLDEISSLHISLSIRNLTHKSLERGAQKKLLKASLQNQAYRSRMVEILARNKRKQASLEQEYSLIRRYLERKYSKILTESYRTKEERSRALDSLFEPTLNEINKFKTLQDQVNLFINDCDKSAWVIKNVVDILTLTIPREHTL